MQIASAALANKSTPEQRRNYRQSSFGRQSRNKMPELKMITAENLD